MCGIAGFLHLRASSPPEAPTIERMLAMIQHRGPDEFGYYVDPHVALGNARLSIVDLAGGQQPISNETGDLWIVYNGEVFNHPELRADLETRGHRFATHTDTEVIVHLYEEYGDAALDRLNGQFAFALWDVRRRELLLARDRLGVRPLFYAVVDGRLVFGSEVKALFAHPAVPRRLDPAGVDQVFRIWSAQAPTTCFAGVQQLPPAHLLRVRDGAVDIRPYWALDFTVDPVRRPAAELAEEFGALLRDATRIRLRADVPVGAYLSGGLDSAVVAALVKSLGIASLDTFSIAFTDPAFDESAQQQRMAAFLGTRHQVARVDHADIARVFPDVVWHAETALTRTAPAPMFLLSRLARAHRYKVVLTGEGADEFLAGYDIFKEAKIRRFWARDPGSRRRPQLLRRLYPEISRLGAAAPRMVEAFFGAGLQETTRPDYSHFIRWRNGQRSRRFYSDDFQRAVAGASLDGLPVPVPAGFARWGDLQQAQFVEAATFLSSYLLSAQGDRPAMAHAIEGRYPFLDVRVVEFCNRLPADVKLPALRDKWLLRQAARNLLPADVVTRRKRPYRAPIHRTFGGDHVPVAIGDALSESALRANGLFAPEPVARLFAAVQGRKTIGENDEMALVGILSTLLLEHRFIRDFPTGVRLPPSAPLKRIDRRSGR